MSHSWLLYVEPSAFLLPAPRPHRLHFLDSFPCCPVHGHSLKCGFGPKKMTVEPLLNWTTEDLPGALLIPMITVFFGRHKQRIHSNLKDISNHARVAGFFFSIRADDFRSATKSDTQLARHWDMTEKTHRIGTGTLPQIWGLQRLRCLRICLGFRKMHTTGAEHARRTGPGAVWGTCFISDSDIHLPRERTCLWAHVWTDSLRPTKSSVGTMVMESQSSTFCKVKDTWP